MEMTVAETVLKEAKQILDELGIVFFLRHGTCLGAIREGCLIAWDDDLDIGSVIGLHGLTEERAYEAIDLFSLKGFNPDVIISESGLSVEMNKDDVPIDWNCYRIIGDSIYQYPVVQIPVGLHTDLKEIDFLLDSDNHYNIIDAGIPNQKNKLRILDIGPTPFLIYLKNWMSTLMSLHIHGIPLTIPIKKLG